MVLGGFRSFHVLVTTVGIYCNRSSVYVASHMRSQLIQHINYFVDGFIPFYVESYCHDLLVVKPSIVFYDL